MVKKKKRKLKKSVIVIIIVFSISILLGGCYMLFHKKDTVKESDNEQSEVNNNISEEEKNQELEEKVDNTIEHAPSNHSEFSKLEDGNYATEKGYTLTIKDGIAYVDGQLIVNKTYSLPQDYKPANSYEEISGEKCNNCLEKEVMEAYKLMQADARGIGLNIYIASGYRSYNYQNTLYNNYTAVSGIEGADAYSARPGHSEHQSGLCFDLNSVTDAFANTNEGIWIQNNAYLYGFIIRYPKGKDSITGYIYESWHLRYVGKELASKLYNSGDWITLEEYYGLSSNY